MAEKVPPSIAALIRDTAEVAYRGAVDVVYNHVPELWSDPVVRRTTRLAAGAVALSAVVTGTAFHEGWPPFE